MQLLKCNIGNWNAEAQIQEANGGKIVAVISLRDKKSPMDKPGSMHTLVFDHHPGQDRIEETKEMVIKILQNRYGSLSSQANA